MCCAATSKTAEWFTSRVSNFVGRIAFILKPETSFCLRRKCAIIVRRAWHVEHQVVAIIELCTYKYLLLSEAQT
jgi:hypothetical protein